MCDIAAGVLSVDVVGCRVVLNGFEDESRE